MPCEVKRKQNCPEATLISASPYLLLVPRPHFLRRFGLLPVLPSTEPLKGRTTAISKVPSGASALIEESIREWGSSTRSRTFSRDTMENEELGWGRWGGARGMELWMRTSAASEEPLVDRI